MQSDPMIDDIDRTGDDLLGRIAELTTGRHQYRREAKNGWGVLLVACEREILQLRQACKVNDMLDSATLDRTGITVEMSHQFIKVMVWHFVNLLKSAGAENYIVFDATADGDRFDVQIAKSGGRTVSQDIRHCRETIAQLNTLLDAGGNAEDLRAVVKKFYQEQPKAKREGEK